MSSDLPDLIEPADPALDGLVRALTATGTADELAGRQAALAMFRDSRGLPRPRRRRRRLALSMSTAATAAVLAGGIAAAYAAVLPAPVQHIAYRMLGSIGVPDTHRPAPSSGPSASGARSSGAPHLATTTPPTHPASAVAGCPCPSGSPGKAAAQDLTMTAALAQIPAGGDDVLSGWLDAGGRPEAGVRVRLSEDIVNGTGWQAAGSAVTNGNGEVTLTVAHLASNASFRLTAQGGAMSSPVFVTVIPRVSLTLAPGLRPGLATLTAGAPFAEAGDVVILQELSGGVWRPVGVRVLGPGHLALFTVRVPLLKEAAYRVVLPRTAVHGRSVSRPVRLAPRLG